MPQRTGGEPSRPLEADPHGCATNTLDPPSKGDRSGARRRTAGRGRLRRLDRQANGPLSVPQGLYLEGITGFWTRVDYGQNLLNSVLISGSVAIGAVVISVLNAYAPGIGRNRGRLWIVVVSPLYWLARQVGLYGTRLSVIIIFTVLQTAFGTYLLSPVLSLPLVFLVSNDTQTVSVALGVLQGQRLMDATVSSASALLGIIPAVLFFLLFQRTLTRGITAGAVK